MWIEFILLGVTFFLWYQWLKPKPPPGFPPGPENYPFVGGAFALGKLGNSGSEMLCGLGKVYGPISGVYFGNKTPTIVINDFEMAKEICNLDQFIDRPRIHQLDFTFGVGVSLGVFFSNGNLWKEQRRWTLRTLRDFGFGKSSLSHIIDEESEETIKDIRKAIKESPDGVTSIHDKFGISVINILWAVVAGTRFSHEDEKLKRIMDVITEGFRSGNTAGSFLQDYRWLCYVPIVNRQLKAFIRQFRTVYGLLKETVDEHKETRDPNFNRDFFDCYLSEMELEEKKGIKDSTFFEQQLIAVVMDLFNAGAESTSNTVAFALLYMVIYPEVQKKVHEELDRVVGRNRLPSWEDKPNLPYMEAVMTESYRLNPIAPIVVPRTCHEDVKFNGYVIPKNSVVLVTLPSIHQDKAYWKDPENFRPERFLDANGQFVKPERVVPFGIGRRACLGEPLARMSAFCLFASVIQKFQFEFPKGMPKPSTAPLDGFTVAPQPFYAKLTLRE